MADFESLEDLKQNRGLIANPKAFAQDANAASWLFLCCEEFATMPRGHVVLQRSGGGPRVGQGGTNEAIAEQLVLSLKTVRNHVANICGKLQVADRA